MKKLRIVLVVLAVLFVATACNGGSNENVQPTRPPVSNLRWQDFKAEAQQCYTRLTGCEPGEENRIYLSHVGERVRWTNYVSFNEGNTVVLNNGQFAIALLGVPNEIIGNLKVGMEVTVEGTIVSNSKWGWALSDVVFEPIVGIDVPQPEINIENVELTSAPYYNVTFTLNNQSDSKVRVCLNTLLSFDEPGYYRLLQADIENDCIIDVQPGETKYSYRLGSVSEDDVNFAELEVGLKAMDPDGSINWESWGVIDHYRQRIQVKEYAYNPSIVLNFDEVRLSSLEGFDNGELTLRYSVVNESGFEVEACMVVEVTTTDYHSPYADHVHIPEAVENGCMFGFEDGSTEFEFRFGKRDYSQRTDALVHLQLLTEEDGNVMAEYSQLLLIKSH